MAKPGPERTVQQSVIDRLRDDDDDATTLSASVEAYRAAVRRDLEWLLNSRRTPAPVPERLEGVRESVFWYGLPDITSLSADSDLQQQRLLRQIERAIATYEPRLRNVRVTAAGRGADDTRQVRFRVEALLEMDPSPERVVFDTVLKTGSGEFEVRGDAGA